VPARKDQSRQRFRIALAQAIASGLTKGNEGARRAEGQAGQRGVTLGLLPPFAGGISLPFKVSLSTAARVSGSGGDSTQDLSLRSKERACKLDSSARAPMPPLAHENGNACMKTEGRRLKSTPLPWRGQKAEAPEDMSRGSKSAGYRGLRRSPKRTRAATPHHAG
jgi:hypothetical protein